MAGAQAGAVVAVEVLVEEDEVLPVGIRLERLEAAVDGAPAVGSLSLVRELLGSRGFRPSVREFASERHGVRVLDMAGAFPDPRLYYDGAHVYDEVNDMIAEPIAAFLMPMIRSPVRAIALPDLSTESSRTRSG